MKYILTACVILAVVGGCSPSPRYTVQKSAPEKTPSSKPGVSKTPEAPISTETPSKIPAETPTETPVEKPPKGKKFHGKASFYAEEFHGRKTANGETYDMYGLTCAHKTLPFNTWLEVKNLSNGRTVIVRVNDRGPFAGDRIIDLSYEAAKSINMINEGVQEVEVTVIR